MSCSPRINRFTSGVFGFSRLCNMPPNLLKLTASACEDSPMPRVSDAFLAELGLKRADHPVHEWGDDPGSRDLAGGPDPPGAPPHAGGGREAGTLLEGQQRSGLQLAARPGDRGVGAQPVWPGGQREPESEPVTSGSMSLNEILTEAAKLTDARHGPPRAPEWAKRRCGRDDDVRN